MKIIQLGSNRGNDSLTRYLASNNIKLDFGLFVEPNPAHLEYLKKCYPDYIIEGVGIKPSNQEGDELKIYYHDRDLTNHEVASVNPVHVLNHIPNSKMEELKSITVKCYSIEQLMDKYNLKELDWLFIDVEGLDAEIALSFDWAKYDIKRVDIEHLHLNDKREAVFNLFKQMGYVEVKGLCEYGHDTGFIKVNPADKPKVYDCFQFFNELDLLEIRLNVTAPYVDGWVISESNKTHSGLDKPMYLRDALNSSNRFDKFKDRIRIVNYEHQGGNAWISDTYGRNCIGEYLMGFAQPNDWIISCDCDEIPDLSKVNFYSQDTQLLHMKHYYYYLNCFTGFDWAAARMFRFKRLAGTNLRDIRISDAGVAVKDAGWHWTYCGGAEKIRTKLQAYAHQEFNTPEYTDLEKIKTCIDEGIDLWGRGWDLKFVEVDSVFPKYLLENIDKYAHLIHSVK